MTDARAVSQPCEPLMLLPGLLCDATIWEPQRAAFAPERVVMVADYGATDSLAAMASAVLRAAPPRFALAGHSMGARVALEVFRLAPERVTRLALLDTGTHPVRPGERAARHELQEHGRQHGMAALVDRWLPPMVADHRHGDAAFMEPLRAMATRPGIAGFGRQIAALLGRRDAEPILADIDCPTLIGVGEYDRWSPPAQHMAIAAAISGAEFVEFPRSGHMAPVEAPEMVIAAMRAWLGREV